MLWHSLLGAAVALAAQDPPMPVAGEGEQLVGVTVERACGVIEVRAPADTVRHAPTIWGTYTLQKSSFNKMSTYRQHTWLCDIPKIMRGFLPDDGDVKFTCPWQMKKADVASAHQHWLYYDAEGQQWLLSKRLGDGRPLMVSPLSDALSPDAASPWAKVNEPPTAWPDVQVACMDKLTHKQPAHGATSREALREMHVLDSVRDSKCLGWRKTGGCDPDGPRQHAQDKGCHDAIKSAWSGYCACASGIRHKVACGHGVFTCADECKITFPHVIAQSGERVWTNQVARNLVRAAGDWMSSKVEDQWVIFDLGAHPRPVEYLKFHLWGSNANPRSVMIQVAPHYLGPWTSAGSFTIPMAAKTWDQPVSPSEPVHARYYRLYMLNNWGALWGMGFSRLEFVAAARAAIDPCGKIGHEDACIYAGPNRDTSTAAAGAAAAAKNCGWCKPTGKCAAGSKDGSTSCSGGNANGGWLWNARTAQGPAADACSAYGSCTECTSRLSCGWCMSSSSCKSSDCRDWGARSCPMDQAAIAAADTAAVAKQTYTIAELGSAALFLFVPAMVMLKNANNRGSGAKMADSSAQWDDGDGEVIEVDTINSYQSTEGAEEYGEESTGLVDEVA